MRHNGFSLLELLVVLAVIAAIMALALPRFGAISRAPEPPEITFLREQRSQAMHSGRANVVVLDEAGLYAKQTEARLRLEPGSEIRVRAPEADAYLPDRVLTTFHPDGTMTAARLVLIHGRAGYVVTLSPFSGINYRHASPP